MATALAALMSQHGVQLARHASPVDELTRLRHAMGPSCPRLFMKRDDLLSFGFGGNKIRKLETVIAEAKAERADVLITCGGVQSNHARATAAAGAALGLDVILVVNGAKPEPLTGNALLDELFGADVRYVAARELRQPTMEQVAAELRAAGRRPFIIPLGASTVTGAIGFARAIGEIASAGIKPAVIMHATSSGGTQAGLIIGCALFGVKSRVIGISADESSATLTAVVRDLVAGAATRLGASAATIGADQAIEVDDRLVGAGYGVPTAGSVNALRFVARTEGVVLDPVYTAKAMAGLIARIRNGQFNRDDTILFWHTGGQPAFFI